MKSKTLIVAGFVTLGMVPVVLWVYQKAKRIELGPVSAEWLATAEYNREGFRD